MSSAADRCIRIILSVSGNGYPRLVSIFSEHSQSKSPLLRKVSYEYLSLLCALWNADVLQKHILALRTAVKTGVGDADAAVRRGARHLYWILQRNTTFQRQMDAMCEALDSGTAIATTLCCAVTACVNDCLYAVMPLQVERAVIHCKKVAQLTHRYHYHQHNYCYFSVTKAFVSRTADIVIL